MTPIWMKTEYEEKILDDRITEDFIESLQIVQHNSDPWYCFVAKYNEWATNYETCINSFIAGRQSFQKSISPSRLLRFCTTSFLSLCFLENIRCKDADSYDAGLVFVGLLLLMSLVTTILSICVTSIDGSSRSVISYTTEVNDALVEMGVRLNRTRRKFRLAVGNSQLYTYMSGPTNNPLLSQNVHLLKLWLQSFLSWYDASGVVFSVQLSILFSIFDCGSHSDVLKCMSCFLALFLALLQDVKFSRSREKMNTHILKSQTSVFLQWFQEECSLRVMMENLGVLNLELLKLFHSEGSSLKEVLTERSLKYVALVVHAAYGLQYSMNSINLTDAIRYFLFKKGNKKSEFFVEEEEKANLQAEVADEILDLTVELRNIITQLNNCVTMSTISTQIEHPVEFNNLNQQTFLNRGLDERLNVTLGDKIQENLKNNGVMLDTGSSKEISLNSSPNTMKTADGEQRCKNRETSVENISNSSNSHSLTKSLEAENATEIHSQLQQPSVKDHKIDSSDTEDSHVAGDGHTRGTLDSDVVEPHLQDTDTCGIMNDLDKANVNMVQMNNKESKINANGKKELKSLDGKDETSHSTLSMQVQNENINNNGLDMDISTPDEIPTNPFPTETDIVNEEQTLIFKSGETSVAEISNSHTVNFQKETPGNVNDCVEKSKKLESMTTNENATNVTSHMNQPCVKDNDKDSSNTADSDNQLEGITSDGENIGDMKIQEKMNTSSIQSSSVEDNQESINDDLNKKSESVSNDNNVEVKIEKGCKTFPEIKLMNGGVEQVSLNQQETDHTVRDDKSVIPLRNSLPEFDTKIIKICTDSEQSNQIIKGSGNNEEVFSRRDETHDLRKSHHEESQYQDVDTSGTDRANTNVCEAYVMPVQTNSKESETNSNGEKEGVSSISDHDGSSDSISIVKVPEENLKNNGLHLDTNTPEDGSDTFNPKTSFLEYQKVGIENEFADANKFISELNQFIHVFISNHDVQTSPCLYDSESINGLDIEKEEMMRDILSNFFKDNSEAVENLLAIIEEGERPRFEETKPNDERVKHTSETSTKTDSVKIKKPKHAKLIKKKPGKDKSLKPIQDKEGTPKVPTNNSNAMITLEKESALTTNPEATNIKSDKKINPQNSTSVEISSTRGFETFRELEGRKFDYTVSNVHTDANKNSMSTSENKSRVEADPANFLLSNPTDDKMVFRFGQTETENETSTKIASLDRKLKKPDLKRKTHKYKSQSLQQGEKQRSEKSIRNTIIKTASEEELSVPINPEATNIQSSLPSISTDVKVHNLEGLKFDGIVSEVHSNASSKEEIFGKKSDINSGAGMNYCVSTPYVLQQNDTGLKFNEEKSKQESLENERTEKSEQNLSNDVDNKCRIESKPNSQSTPNECVGERESVPFFYWNRNSKSKQNEHVNEVDPENELGSNKMETCKNNISCVCSQPKITLPKFNAKQSEGKTKLGGGIKLLDSSDPEKSEAAFMKNKKQNGMSCFEMNESTRVETSRPLPHSENIHSTEHKTNSNSELQNRNSCQKDQPNDSSAVFSSNYLHNHFSFGQKMETRQVLLRDLVPDALFPETLTAKQELFPQFPHVDQIMPVTQVNKQTEVPQDTKVSENTKSRHATPLEHKAFPQSIMYDLVSETERTKSIINEPQHIGDQSILNLEYELAALTISANHKNDFTQKWINSVGTRANFLNGKEDVREEQKTIEREITPEKSTPERKSGLKKRRSRNYYSSCNEEENIADQCKQIKTKESCNDTVRLLNFYTSVMKTRDACVFVKNCKNDEIINATRHGFSKFRRQIETKCISIKKVEGKQVSSAEFAEMSDEAVIPSVSSRNRYAKASRQVENFEDRDDDFRRLHRPEEAKQTKVRACKKKKWNRRSVGRHPNISSGLNRFQETDENYSTDEKYDEGDCYPELHKSPNFESASRSPERQQTLTDRNRSQPIRWGSDLFKNERTHYHPKDHGFSSSEFSEIPTSSNEIDSEISYSKIRNSNPYYAGKVLKACWDSKLCLDQKNASKSSVEIFESGEGKASNETRNKLWNHSKANPELSVVQDSSLEPQTCNLNIGNLSLKFSNNSAFTLKLIQGSEYESGTDTTKTPSSHSEIQDSVKEYHRPVINQKGTMEDTYENQDISLEQLEEIEVDAESLKKKALPTKIQKSYSDSLLKDSTCVEILDESSPTPDDNPQGSEEAANAFPLPPLRNTSVLNQQSEIVEGDTTLSKCISLHSIDRQCQLSEVSETEKVSDYDQDYNFEASGLEFNFRPTPQSRALQIQYRQKQSLKRFIFKSNSVKLYLKTKDT